LTIQKPTIDDVASLAGVGRTTVSRVLNNGPNVREEIRQRVRRAVKLLDYKINIQARNLAGGSGRQIALIYASDLETEPNSYYHAGLEIGALRACAAQGFHLVAHTVSPNGASTDAQVVALIDDGLCNGMILTPPLSDRLELVEQICGKGCPVVCISAGVDVQRVAVSVGIDDNAAGFAIAKYLLDLGHRKFGYIHGISGHLSAESRFDGFLRALQTHGIAPEQVQVERGNFTFHSGIDAAQRLLARKERPTALACGNDDMAAGALLSIHKMGLEIPRDISVTGFDDTPVSEIVWPPLTTVHQPIKTMAQRAVDVIIDAVATGRRVNAAKHETIDFRLIVRDSCARPTH